MSEGLSAGEVAHEMVHRHGHGHRPSAGWREEIVEIVEAILLAVVAVATAWSGYQTALWDGEQSSLYSRSSAERVLSTKAANLGGQEELYDSSTFSFWLENTLLGKHAIAKQFERRFRPEFRPAFSAWQATHPFTNPKAPPGPLVMPQYKNAELVAARVHDARAEAAYQKGTHARHTGDDYLRNLVLLATVLFLAALAPRFKVYGVRVSLLVVAGSLLVVALYFVATYPTV